MIRLILLVSLLLTSPIFGQLQWDALEQDQQAKPGDKEAIAKFHFVNASHSTIKVIDLRTSCGCTTAALAKDQYAPGDMGVIEARFEFGAHTGHQEKTIAVTTSDSLTHPTFLRLIVDIPRAVVLQPEFVFWRVGEPLGAKKFRVIVGNGFSARVLGVESDNPDIHFFVDPITPQKELEVSVIPKESKRPQNAMLSIKTDYPPENPLTYYMYVLVQ
jgi:Protein of unknown function (DUF1573)